MSFDPEIWGTVSDWVVAATAVGAVWFGREQLIRVAEESARQADVARADLMLQIDQLFEGDAIGASRMAIQTLRNDCEAKSLATNPDASEPEHKAVSATLFAAHMNALYEAYKTPDTADSASTAEPAHVVAGQKYVELMALPYWMETVGLLACKGLLKRDDVLDLYDAAFIGVLDCFDAHIAYRREERLDRDDRFLEYATRFRDAAKLRAANLPQGRRNRFS